MSQVTLYKTVLKKVAIVIHEDGKKLGAYEDATDLCLDSGICSGENLTSSEDLGDSGYQQHGRFVEEEPHTVRYTVDQSTDSGFVSRRQEDDMRVDSGFIGSALSDSFSGLKLDKSQNDLGSKSRITQPLVDESKQQPKGELTWDECFQQDEDGDTPLHVAIVQGFVEIALALIRMAPRPFLLDTPNDSAQTPLHLAAATGQWQIVKWLMAAGAKPSPRNVAGDSPLHIATRNGDLNCCRAIVEPVLPQERETLALSYPQQTKHQLNLDQWNYEGQTCVHLAAIDGQIEVLQYLVQKGADINAREGHAGYTALHYAIETRNERLATFLLRDCQSLNWGAVTYGGCSALQLGCKVPSGIATALKNRNVPDFYDSSSSSEDESDSDSDSDSKMSPPSQIDSSFVPNLVNASA